MCASDKKYFVFSMRNGVVDSLLGSATDVPFYEDLIRVDEVVKLPKAFMLGHSFDATVIKSRDGARGIAYIEQGKRPLAI